MDVLHQAYRKHAAVYNSYHSVLLNSLLSILSILGVQVLLHLEKRVQFWVQWSELHLNSALAA